MSDTLEEEHIARVMKEYNGMITKDMAKSILTKDTQKGHIKVDINDIISNKVPVGRIVDLSEHVYRIFNRIRFDASDNNKQKRTIVLGKEQSTLPLTLWDKKSDLADVLPIERNDIVHIQNLKVIKTGPSGELSSTQETHITKTSSGGTAISDFSKITGNEKNIDIIGRIVSLSQIRYFMDLSGKQSSISDCIISDGKIELRLVLWKSSSQAVAEMHPGDYIKVEFVNTKQKDSGIEIVASDTSRILINNSLYQRLSI